MNTQTCTLILTLPKYIHTFIKPTYIHTAYRQNEVHPSINIYIYMLCIVLYV